jgi:hypothetical protein
MVPARLKPEIVRVEFSGHQFRKSSDIRCPSLLLSAIEARVSTLEVLMKSKALLWMVSAVSRKSILWGALTAVLAIAAIMPGLQAGPAMAGRFKLQFDAQVGKTALPTGDYTFSVDRATGTNGVILVYREGQALGIVVPQELDRYKGEGLNPELLCIRHDGKVTVRAMRLPGVGTYYFEMPKNLRTFVAQQPQLIETVPVQMGGE